MKLPPSKAEIREQLEKQMQEFLCTGGEVTDVPRGLSGREGATGPIGHQNSFTPSAKSTVPAEDTKPLNDVVRSIEARRKSGGAKTPAKPAAKKPKRVMIYDDFGEPLRWEWVNE